MSNTRLHHRRRYPQLIFAALFGVSLLFGAIAGLSQPANAAEIQAPLAQATGYVGAQKCAECHEEIVTLWQSTRHANAYSSPIFQKDWVERGSASSCLSCHTTGFDANSGEYHEQGVSCEACHGAFQEGHPLQQMPIEPDAQLCSTCHKNTTDEWQASPHSAAGVQCKSCHDPHAQMPKAATVTALCSNCHKERGDSFTHGTHASSGLECSNCHMYTKPRVDDPIEGLIPTGHTFSVGSDACIGCHQDTVHTRDTIVQLTGASSAPPPSVDELQQLVHAQEEEITTVKAQADVRLYTGLAQGAIVGLLTGGAAAWVVGRRITVVEVEENG
jgi:hypothetical protein